MTVTCANVPNTQGRIHVDITYQLMEGCGNSEASMGRNAGSGDYSEPNGCDASCFDLFNDPTGICYTNTSRQTISFDVDSSYAVLAPPNVCWLNTTNVCQGACDYNHMQGDSGNGSPAGIGFVNYQ